MPAYRDRVWDQMFPRMEDTVLLGYSKAKNIAWLDFHSTKYLIDGTHDGGEVYRMLIGAVLDRNGWRTIVPGYITQGCELPIHVGDAHDISRFQKEIRDQWDGFTHERAKLYGKGWSSQVGLKTLTSANFIVKALKEGFEAIGKYRSFGDKHTRWTIDDLQRFAAPWLKVMPAGLGSFEAVLPNPYYDGPTYPKDKATTNHDPRAIPLIPSSKAARHPGTYAYADELRDLPREFPRRVTYSFRGDTRDPVEIQKTGFIANFTRPSHIKLAKEQMNLALSRDVKWETTPPMYLPRFLQSQTLGEFISTSKSVAIAQMFATTTWPDGNPATHTTDGWVYACYVEGAIEVPPLGSYRDQTGLNYYDVPFNEQELSMPGIIEWKDVKACRKVLQDGRFTGPIYIDPMLQHTDPTAAPIIYDLLSGKSQGPGL